ncbi:hypothetical protein Q1695_011495 [Nippostrongylus brasiliensis]|nr:hypothetical protein Q1695_011495 [Nippostrongylus brasiliensis]
MSYDSTQHSNRNLFPKEKVLFYLAGKRKQRLSITSRLTIGEAGPPKHPMFIGNMGDVASSFSPVHMPFFILYIVMISIAVLLHIRFMTIILRSRSLYELAAYRILLHLSLANTVNLLAQLTAIAMTLDSDKMNYTVNVLCGAIFQASWAVDYPTILILALHRLLAIFFPFSMDRVFSSQTVNILIILCYVFGVFNGAICFSGDVQTLWYADIPAFAFVGESFLADLLRFIDFYFAEFIIFASLFCYVFVVTKIIMKTVVGRISVEREAGKSNKEKFALSNLTVRYNKTKEPTFNSSVKAEISLLLHFGSVFLLSAIVLLLWHHPASDSDLYYHVFNAIVLLRFSVTPILATITTKTIRQEFLRGCGRQQQKPQCTVTVVASMRNL